MFHNLKITSNTVWEDFVKYRHELARVLRLFLVDKLLPYITGLLFGTNQTLRLFKISICFYKYRQMKKINRNYIGGGNYKHKESSYSFAATPLTTSFL